MATEALTDLGWILENRGWERSGKSPDHWYANAYVRHVIERSEPLKAVTPTS